MSNELMITAGPLAVPIVAGLIGWFALWRRNSIIYRIENSHFCGDEISEKGFWVGKGKRRPLIDTMNIDCRNFGLRHIEKAEFILFNISDDFIIHPYHHNDIPGHKFETEMIDDHRLLVSISDIPAFEKFGFSLLNTHPARKFSIQGGGKSYRFVSSKVYRRNLGRVALGISSLFVALLSIVNFLTNA